MIQVNIHEAKTHLSRLLAKVAEGEDVIIANAGTPVARLSAYQDKRKRVLGRDRGLFKIPDDFDAPLPDDVLDSFEA
jgi:prevent-host-death family protein